MPARTRGQLAANADAGTAHETVHRAKPFTLFDMNVCMFDRGGNLKSPVPITLFGLLMLLMAGLYLLVRIGGVPADTVGFHLIAALMPAFIAARKLQQLVHGPFERCGFGTAWFGWYCESGAVVATGVLQLAVVSAVVATNGSAGRLHGWGATATDFVLTWSAMVLIAVVFSMWACLLNMAVAVAETVVGTTVTEQWKQQRIALLLEGIKKHDADCVVLQEMLPWCFSSVLFDNLVASAAELGYTYHAASPGRPEYGMQLVGGGQLLLSRFPVVRSCWQYFKCQVLTCGVCRYSLVVFLGTHLWCL